MSPALILLQTPEAPPIVVSADLTALLTWAVRGVVALLFWFASRNLIRFAKRLEDCEKRGAAHDVAMQLASQREQQLREEWALWRSALIDTYGVHPYRRASDAKPGGD